MSLNDNHMLPERVRNMRQMKDVLTAEDIILIEVERIIDEMYQRASLLHEELINELWMKSKLEERTGAVAEVSASAERLLVTIILNVTSVHSLEVKDVRKFINKWLPAHLMYQITLLMESNCIIKEKFFMKEMALGFMSQFWKVRTLNGSWLLDGSCNLDAVRKQDEYGLLYGCGATAHEEKMSFGVVLKKDLWVLDGSENLNGERLLDAEKREEKL